MAALADPETKEFATWFQDQNFAPSDPSLPPSLPGLDTLPDLPDLSLTELPGGESNEGNDALDLDAAIGEDDSETGEQAADDTSEDNGEGDE